MKIGLKLYPDKMHIIEKFRELFDYFEMLVTPELDLNILKNLSTEITLHAAHLIFGFNMADPAKTEHNHKLLSKAVEAADIVDAKWIVVHPGWDVGAGSEKTILDFLKDNFDKRFIFENVPIRADPKENKYLFSTPDTMARLLKIFNAKMLLDFSHAIVTANTLGLDPYQVIKDFEKLNPRSYHISGEEMYADNDNHKNLFDVSNDFRFLKWIDHTKYITLETDHTTYEDKEAHLKNIEIIRSLTQRQK